MVSAQNQKIHFSGNKHTERMIDVQERIGKHIDNQNMCII